MVGIFETLFVGFGFVEFDDIFEEVGFFFGEGTALACLGIVVGGVAVAAHGCWLFGLFYLPRWLGCLVWLNDFFEVVGVGGQSYSILILVAIATQTTPTKANQQTVMPELNAEEERARGC